jgi:hypothetical protein
LAAPGTGAQHAHLARQFAPPARATVPAKEVAAGSGGRGRSDAATLPNPIAGGIIGSSLGGNASFTADEVTAFQEQSVAVLESHPDAAEHVWTSPSRKTVRFKLTGTTEDRTFEVEVRRKPDIDALPRYGVIGATYVALVASPVYAGFSVDKPAVDHLRPGDKIFILGQVESDHDWLIVGRNDQAIGYVPADRLQKEEAGPSAAVRASDTRRPATQPSDGATERVSIVTRCRSLSYAVDANGTRIENGTLAACKNAQGGWSGLPGARADAQSPAPGGNPVQLRSGHR